LSPLAAFYFASLVSDRPGNAALHPHGHALYERMPMTTIDRITADFELLDDWEDRYRYLIELGRQLQPLPESQRTDANKVRGCASQVWLWTRTEERGGRTLLRFVGDSDALIVRGLVAIAVALFDDHTAAEIAALDAEAVFDRLQLRQHLTAQRSNGLRALVDRIKAVARAAAAADQSIVGR
jgi:cysteine desulfuration protein SufE